jgi:hypothetical protein
MAQLHYYGIPIKSKGKKMLTSIRGITGASCLLLALLAQGCSKEPAPAAPQASESATAPASTAAETAGVAKVESAIALDGDTPPATTFQADVPKLNAFFRSEGTKQGDKFRGVWIAEDVGDVAPKETKIDEAGMTADKDNFYGAFSLSKPTKGWPVGKYRAETYVNDKLASTAKFTIAEAK